MDEEQTFKNLYDKFVGECLTKVVDFPFHYQRFPTFRIHQPDNVGVFEFHKDKEYNHSEHEINIFLPMTTASGTNTIWVESEEDKEDYRPMSARYGEFCLWNGANLKHGSMVNDTPTTRVSFDFRILPVDKYDESKTKESVTGGVNFTIDGYFQELKNV
jgi:ectoine hydroxylase-related dioxygenase (phytanoyl-CoA dioxygenase family)